MWSQFLSELKRRRVIRVAGVYAVTCWAIFQVVSALFPVLHLPAWTVTLVAVLLMLGFPIALIISWAFEQAEGGGVRRTTPAGKGAAPAKVGWGDWALIAAASAIIGLSAAQMTGLLPTLGAARGGGEAEAPQKSVAVLPFANFSSQKDSELFADGMTEEVINGLAQIPDLKVAGRTSAFYFKGRNDDLRVIGRRLGVSHVLEGSIRQEGDRLRVTVQLIKVSDGFHMWSQTYDRTMSDAFAIQTEISARVADVLKAKLDIAGPTPAPTQLDPQSYGAALVAKAQLRRMGLSDLTAARGAFKGLIDQNHADASIYAGYALSTMLLAQDHLALDINQADTDAAGAIAKGLALDPKSPEVQTARGFRCMVRMIRMSDQGCATEAQTAFDTALQLAPRDPDVLVYAANFLMRRGDSERGMAMLQKAIEIDPLNRVALMLLAGAEGNLGHTAEAERRYRAIVDLYPDFVSAKQDLGSTLVTEGKLDQAEPWLRAAASPGSDPAAALTLANLYLNLGMTDRFNATLDGMKEPPIVANLAVSIRKVVASDFAGSRAFAQQRWAENHDPVWLSAIADADLMTGDYEDVRKLAAQALPGLFAPEPQVDVSLADETASVALVLDRLGDKAQSRRIIEKLLAVTAPKPGIVQSREAALARARAYAILGDADHAVAEIKGLVDNGYRHLWHEDRFIRLDALPEFATLKNDPRFQTLIRQIETDNARMKAALLARG